MDHTGGRQVEREGWGRGWKKLTSRAEGEVRPAETVGTRKLG